MKKLVLCLGLLYCVALSRAQDTFSIVAVDSTTGEVGSAGASCLGIILPLAPHGAKVISDVLPGRGAIHTQAQYDMNNQQNAHAQMISGQSPAQIIKWLNENDSQGDSSVRQYGVVDLNNGHPRSAGFTGSFCMDHKSHLTGPGYAIQGNILLGRKILDSIEARFKRTSGPLSDRLMAALQGANVVGADTRCAPRNTSSLSAFVRVARTTDSSNNLYLDLHMSYENNVSGTLPIDPIDSLQKKYDYWKAHIGITENNLSRPSAEVRYDGQSRPFLHLENFRGTQPVIRITDQLGRIISSQPIPAQQFYPELPSAPGIYYFFITGTDAVHLSGKLVQGR